MAVLATGPISVCATGRSGRGADRPCDSAGSDEACARRTSGRGPARDAYARVSSTSARTIRASTTSSWTAPPVVEASVDVIIRAAGSFRRGLLINPGHLRAVGSTQVQGRLHRAAQVFRVRGADVVLIVVDTDMPDDGTQSWAQIHCSVGCSRLRSRWPLLFSRHVDAVSAVATGSCRHGRPSRAAKQVGHLESG